MKKTTKKSVKKVKPEPAYIGGVDFTPPETKPNFSITLTINGEVYKGQGQTALEALQAIPKPQKIMAKGVFSITDGEKKKEILLQPLRLRRLFFNKTLQQIQLKSLCSIMK